jgi:hypothetical protein
MGEFELILEVFSSDLIQGTGRYSRSGNAQLFRLGQNFFVSQAEFL